MKTNSLDFDAQALREKILDLAMRGKLVKQDPNDEPASALLEKIKAEKAELVKEKKIKKSKPLPEITDDEKPFHIPDSWKWVRGEDIVSLIRPTGLLDPEITIHGTQGQIDDLISEIRKTVAQSERVLVTTLTKKMAEDLTDYLKQNQIRVRYLHSDIDTIERMKILRELRLGKFDVLVGINLLREGLDLPEVGLVAILDADKEGYLRSETSLIQTIGRAARNSDGHVIMYADTITKSMDVAIKETQRRRRIQREYNQKHHIIPRTVKKDIHDIIEVTKVAETPSEYKKKDFSPSNKVSQIDLEELNKEMLLAASQLDFEKAAKIRDLIKKYKGKK